MNEITAFNHINFGVIRTIMVNDEPCFIGKDIAEALGYNNPRDAIRKHVDEDDKGVAKCDTLGGVQDLTYINESGLYSLILSSKLPTAKKFKRWITSEVLPSIRKHGGYIAGQEEMSGEELLSKALLFAQSKLEEKDRIIQQKAERIEEMRPKEVFADTVSASQSAILVRDLAKMLRQNGVKTGEKRLYKWLRNNGYICQNSTAPTQRAMEQGLFEIQEISVQRADMPPLVRTTTKVSGKGQVYFVNKIMEAGGTE